MRIAQEAIDENAGVKTTVLELHRLASEYGRMIHPCKACFSTSPALCHWPCSCYPNYSLGQVDDWMNEIYPMWVEAHGIMIFTPVNWYQVSSPVKLMMDRLVCADGGNPDPTATQGKDVKLAKALEFEGWNYPRHLAGRLFSVIVHGDVEGAENVRRSLSDWLCYMHLEPAAHWRSWTAISATGNPTHRATMNWTPTRRCRKRCATRHGHWLRRLLPSEPESWLPQEKSYRRHGRNSSTEVA